MDFLKRFAQGELGLGRIEAFSDGVFAIVVTLLVLEFKVLTLMRNRRVHISGKWRPGGQRDCS